MEQKQKKQNGKEKKNNFIIKSHKFVHDVIAVKEEQDEE